jgi:NAD(P)-dependent dehydrogenase (short-subunit alcohol dehydrogenase family)
MAGRLEGKVCVITGAASGIGAETVRVFREEGARVAGIDLRDDIRGTDLALAASVADEQAVEHAYAQVREAFGRIDVLVNNAGISPDDDGSVLDTTLGTWERVIAVNLTSVFLCCKHGIPHLLEAGGGSVINTASFVAVMGAATSQIAYTASKGGVLALSRELGVQFASTRRCCASCSPRTPSVRRGGSCTCRGERSAKPRRSPAPRCSSPRTTRPSSMPRPSSSTAASPAPT